MADEKDYHDFPRTIGEIRADKSWNAADWSPRDVLINVLRDIDNNTVNPTALIVCYETSDRKATYAVSSPFLSVTLGLMTRIKNRLLQHDVL